MHGKYHPNHTTIIPVLNGITAWLGRNLQWRSWDRCDRMRYSTLLRGGPGFAGAGACAHSCWRDRWSWSAGPPSAPSLWGSSLLVEVKSKNVNTGRRRDASAGLGWPEIALKGDICYCSVLYFWLCQIKHDSAKQTLAHTKREPHW